MGTTKMGKWQITDEELDRDFQEATAQGNESLLREPHATRVYYDNVTRRLMIELTSGVLVGIPTEKVQGLTSVSASEIAKVRLERTGDAIRWDALDLDFGIPNMIAGVVGTRGWMAELGRRGGSVQSEAKAIAARENGLRGGRPQSAIKHWWVKSTPQPDGVIFVSGSNIARTNLPHPTLNELPARIETVKNWYGGVDLSYANLSTGLLTGKDFAAQIVTATMPVANALACDQFVIGATSVKEAANSEELALAA